MKTMKTSIFFLVNLVSQEVEGFNPVAAPCELPRAVSKEEHLKWAQAPCTKDAFLSCFEGRDPRRRIRKDNPAVAMHGIICDYDRPISEEQREAYLAELKVKPSYISASYSGGTRTIYLFAEPIKLVDDPQFNRSLLKAIRTALKLDELFGGKFDEGAFERSSQYYHRGWGLREAGGEPIAPEVTQGWVKEAWKEFYREHKTPEVPLETIESAIREKYPDALGGKPLKVGARFRRFWDPEAKNETAAECKINGFRCYSGDVPFMRWSDILGPDVWEDLKDDRENKAVNDFYFACDHFWYQPEPGKVKGTVGKWASLTRRNAETILASVYGLAKAKAEGEVVSRVERVIAKIISRKSLQGVLPALYRDEDVVEHDGMRYLNMGTVQAMPPAEEKGATWGDGFEWIAGFLTRLFGEEQLPYFLSWLARTYQGALEHAPKRGQALFIAGEAGTGKTFLSAQIIAPLLGGRTEATSYLKGETEFNDSLFYKGVWNVDDATPLTDRKVHRHYSAMIKQLAANADFMYHPKYVRATKVVWLGRLVVTLNTDESSLGMLPAVDMSNQDKVMFFRTGSKVMEDSDPEAKAAAELPYFARYMSRYEIPEECRGGARFGVKSWLHPDLYGMARENSVTESFREVFRIFLDDFFGVTKDRGDRDSWKAHTELRGSSTEVLMHMKGVPCLERLMDDITSPVVLGRRLNSLFETGTFPPLERERSGERRLWIVTKEKYQEYPARESD